MIRDSVASLKPTKTSEQFALNSARYLSMMGFDGIDIDWEFPAWFTPFEERFLFQILYGRYIKSTKTQFIT